MSCLRVYAKRYAPLLAEMRADLQEFLATGTIGRARRLAAATGQHFNADRLPQFFTGDLDGPVVLVHLNPKQANAPVQHPGWQTTARTLEEYFDACRHFGARTYGPASPRTHPLAVRPQADPVPAAAGRHRLRPRARPRRPLHQPGAGGRRQAAAGTGPYGSASFSTRGFTPAVLAPHYDRVLAAIAAVPRRYVLFCGAVFTPLLRQRVTRWHEFYLRKHDGTLTRQRAGFANLLLPHHGGQLRAGLAPSWARQGIPMAAYAEEIRSRYDDAAQ